MTEAQLAAYEQLNTARERARFLLAIGVTAAPDTDESGRCYRASVGDIRLPVTGATKLSAIERATAWLKEKAGMAGQGA